MLNVINSFFRKQPREAKVGLFLTAHTTHFEQMFISNLLPCRNVFVMDFPCVLKICCERHLKLSKALALHTPADGTHSSGGNHSAQWSANRLIGTSRPVGVIPQTGVSRPIGAIPRIGVFQPAECPRRRWASQSGATPACGAIPRSRHGIPRVGTGRGVCG